MGEESVGNECGRIPGREFRFPQLRRPVRAVGEKTSPVRFEFRKAKSEQLLRFASAIDDYAVLRSGVQSANLDALHLRPR